jgi:hypothetical protein
MKLPDNFQIREHSWPCLFHINTKHTKNNKLPNVANDAWCIFRTIFFGHCVVCSSSIYGFWLPPFGIFRILITLWYLRYTDSDYPFGIFKLFTSGSIIYKYISNKGGNPANNHKYVHYFSACIHSMLLYKANFVRFISNLHGRFLILWCQQLQK